MVGRPDPKAGGEGKLWLSGAERTNLLEGFVEHGLAIVADPYPEQNFFQRSDNIVFVDEGIVLDIGGTPACDYMSFFGESCSACPDDADPSCLLLDVTDAEAPLIKTELDETLDPADYASDPLCSGS